MESLINHTKEIKFGDIKLDANLKELYKRLNNKLVELTKKLPQSMQTDASLFLINYTSFSYGGEMDFFRNFYIPTWSLIYHISTSPRAFRELTDEEMDSALMVQAMVMFLHSIDDHLNDREIECSHLLLFIRSQAYMELHNFLDRFVKLIAPDDRLKQEGAKEIISAFINDYYTYISPDEYPVDYMAYCESFRKEISTWYIMPTLICKYFIGDDSFGKDMLGAFQAFGIGWRLLDDIQDLEEDLLTGVHSGCYYILPEEYRNKWDSVCEAASGGNDVQRDQSIKEIYNYLTDNRIIERLENDIIREMNIAIDYANKIGLTELASEYKSLKEPVELLMTEDNQ